MTFNVANIISAFNWKSGGPPRSVVLMATAGAGHWNSMLFTTNFLESTADGLLADEYPGRVQLLPDRLHGTLGGLSMLAGFDRSVKSRLRGGAMPDIVHIHGMWSPFLATFAREARRLGIPYVVAPHGMLERWSLSVRSMRKSIALKSYQGRVISGASALHATSEPEAENLRSLTAGRIPVFVVPNAIEQAGVVGMNADLTADDAPLGNESTFRNKGTLLFLSRLHEKKGLDILLRAWNELRPENWRLLIVGSGEARYTAQLLQFCASNAVPNVEFKSHVEGAEREMVFRQASVFVLPTYSENFGNAIGEALIRGLPVITTTGTPWSDIVSQGCGWYIEPTLDELKRVIAEAVGTDPHMLRRMGECGRRYVTANFSIAMVRGALLRMYQAALQGRAQSTTTAVALPGSR